jgi:hypothetical protein
MSFAASLVLVPLFAFASPAVAILDDGPADAATEPQAAAIDEDLESLPEELRPGAESALKALKLDEQTDPARLRAALTAIAQQEASVPEEAKPLVAFLKARVQARIAQLEGGASGEPTVAAEPAAAEGAATPETAGAMAPAPAAANQEALDAFMHAALIARPDLAKSALEVVLAEGVSGEELATIVDQRGMTDRLERAVIACRGQAELAEPAMRLLAKVAQGRNALARDPARIGALVSQLKGTMRQQSQALRQLEQAGAYAMPALLKALVESNDSQLELMASRVMVAIGRNAVMPLCVALPSLPGAQQAKICQVLGDIGWKAAAPALVALRAAPDAQPGAKEAAAVALRRMGVTATEPAPMWAALAKECLTGGEGLVPYPQDATQPLWSFDAHHGLMPTTVSTPAYLDVLARGFALRAMKVDSADGGALATYLAAGLRLEAMQVEVPGSRLTPSNLVMLAGPSVAQQVLALAIAIRDPGLQRSAIRTLSATGGAASLVQGGPSSPLVACLDSSSQRVRLEAALAIARANPTMSFARSDAVVPLLAGAVRSSGRPAAAVVAPQAEDRANFEAWLEARGFEVVASEAAADALAQAMAGRGSVEMVVVSGAPGDASAWARGVRGSSVTGGALMVLAVAEADAGALDRSLRDDRSTTVWFLGGGSEQFSGAIDELMQRSGGGAMGEGEAASIADQCIDALVGLGRSGGGAFRIADGQMALIEALRSQSGPMQAKVAEALSWVPTQDAQRAMFDAAIAAAGRMSSADQMAAVSTLLRAAAAHARRFGDKADPAQVQWLRDGLKELAVDHVRGLMPEVPSESVVDLQSAVAECYGSLNLGPQQSIGLIVD